MKENKLKAFVIERTISDKNGNEWGMVNLTELTEDDIWHSGLMLITSIEDVVEKSAKLKVPIWTREYLEGLKKK